MRKFGIFKKCDCGNYLITNYTAYHLFKYSNNLSPIKSQPAAKRGQKATDLIEKAELPWVVTWLFLSRNPHLKEAL